MVISYEVIQVHYQKLPKRIHSQNRHIKLGNIEIQIQNDTDIIEENEPVSNSLAFRAAHGSRGIAHSTLMQNWYGTILN